MLVRTANAARPSRLGWLCPLRRLPQPAPEPGLYGHLAAHHAQVERQGGCQSREQDVLVQGHPPPEAAEVKVEEDGQGEGVDAEAAGHPVAVAVAHKVVVGGQN